MATALPVVEPRIQCHYFPDTPRSSAMILICFVSLRCEVSHDFIISMLYCRLSGILDDHHIADVKRGWFIGRIYVRMADPGGHTLARIAVSNPTGGMDVSLLLMLCCIR